MLPACSYRVVRADTAQRGVPLDQRVLCTLQFGGAVDERDPRRLLVPLQPLIEDARLDEWWISSTPVRYGWDGEIGYSENGSVMLLQLHLPEACLESMEAAVCALYQRLIRYVEDSGYPHLLRVWNYLGDINRGAGDAERYRRFCTGRHRALEQTGTLNQPFPAATAIGSRGDDGLRLFALAARHPGQRVENPRQVSAFKYPRHYGPRSPSFSRATWAPWADGAQLLVSGTASIVGHATVHADDPRAQLQQAVANLETVRAQAVKTQLPDSDPSRLHLESCFVYVRRASDLPELQPLIAELFGGVSARVLGGDICRSELLVEVEAIYRQRE